MSPQVGPANPVLVRPTPMELHIGSRSKLRRMCIDSIARAAFFEVVTYVPSPFAGMIRDLQSRDPQDPLKLDEFGWFGTGLPKRLSGMVDICSSAAT